MDDAVFYNKNEEPSKQEEMGSEDQHAQVPVTKEVFSGQVDSNPILVDEMLSETVNLEARIERALDSDNIPPNSSNHKAKCDQAEKGQLAERNETETSNDDRSCDIKNVLSEKGKEQRVAEGASVGAETGDDGNHESIGSMSPILSPSMEKYLENELSLTPEEKQQIMQVVRDYDVNLAQPEVEKKAHDIFQDFLNDPAIKNCLKCAKEFMWALLYKFLLSSGNYDQSRDASQHLIKQFENDKSSFFVRVGLQYLLQPVSIPNAGMEQGKADASSSNQPTGSGIDAKTAKKMETDSGSAQRQEMHDITFAEENPTAKNVTNDILRDTSLNPDQQLEYAENETFIANLFGCSPELADEHEPATATSSQSSMKNKCNKKKSVLYEKLQGALGKAYAEMNRFSDSRNGDKERIDKIKAGGKVFFGVLFSPEEILEGTLSGKKPGKNKPKSKYNVQKIAAISEILAWLLDKPLDITLRAFRAYKAETKSIGLVDNELKTFRKAIFVDYANLERAKLKSAINPNEAPSNSINA